MVPRACKIPVGTLQRHSTKCSVLIIQVYHQTINCFNCLIIWSSLPLFFDKRLFYSPNCRQHTFDFYTKLQNIIFETSLHLNGAGSIWQMFRFLCYLFNILLIKMLEAASYKLTGQCDIYNKRFWWNVRSMGTCGKVWRRGVYSVNHDITKKIIISFKYGLSKLQGLWYRIITINNVHIHV